MASLAAETCGEESCGNFTCKFDAYYSGAHTKNVHIVVLYALMGRVSIVAHGCTNTVYFSCGDAGTNSAAAYEYASVRVTTGNGPCDSFGVIRVIIVGVIAVSSNFHHFNTLLGENNGKLILKLKPRMVCSKRDLHNHPTN